MIARLYTLTKCAVRLLRSLQDISARTHTQQVKARHGEKGAPLPPTHPRVRSSPLPRVFQVHRLVERPYQGNVSAGPLGPGFLNMQLRRSDINQSERAGKKTVMVV